MKSKHIDRRKNIYLIIKPIALGFLCWTIQCGAAEPGEEQIGRSAAAQILGAAPLHESAEVQRYVNLLGNAVARNSASKYRWRFAVVNSSAVNAFAAPAGFVLLSSGLLKLLDSEHELAYVIAHEVAHVTRKHHLKVIRRQQLAETAHRELQAEETDQDLLKVTQMSVQIYARGLDRNSEFEADRIGVEIMTRAGYDPTASIDVLAKLIALQGNDPRAELLFSTHPSPGERLDKLIEAGVEHLPRPGSATGEMDKRFVNFKSKL
jgi:predicted Zn-dependent protease